MKDYSSRKYIKVGEESGCISASYNARNDGDEMRVIVYENNEMSGSIKKR
ncbi:MAG TPA: hypothetical protein PLL98_01160 [Bacillota bacterium]|nr:hypothetical protein [Bacillota bacterium]HOR85069.1 hypothetical protein [Bacillota bacterium]HPL54126.1 hypothetical protein [Bacillota bacterium]